MFICSRSDAESSADGGQVGDRIHLRHLFRSRAEWRPLLGENSAAYASLTFQILSFYTREKGPGPALLIDRPIEVFIAGALLGIGSDSLAHDPGGPEAVFAATLARSNRIRSHWVARVRRLIGLQSTAAELLRSAPAL